MCPDFCLIIAAVQNWQLAFWHTFIFGIKKRHGSFSQTIIMGANGGKALGIY
jgi:hypothetical protein